MRVFGGYVNTPRPMYFQVKASEAGIARTRIAQLADISGLLVPHQTREGLKYHRPVPSDVHTIQQVGVHRAN